jgi:CheY-like chemotaxis protein
MDVVLVVDDDPAIRQMVESMLQLVGYGVLGAASGSEALDMCSHDTQQIDAVVADVVMPGMTGTEMVQQMRLNGINIPVLYISGYTDAEVGGAPLLLKPFKLEALLKHLHEVIESGRRPATRERGGRKPQTRSAAG